MSLERTNDPVEALGWAFELLGAGSPAAFLLVPARFEVAERTADSLALTLRGERVFGAGFGPHPPVRPEWESCVISHSAFGPRVGPLVYADQWDFFTYAVTDTHSDGEVDELNDDVALTEFLRREAPRSAIWPGNIEIVAWFAITDERGLASVAALVRWESGYHVVSSVATRADVRGRGLGQRVVSDVVRAASSRHLRWLGLGVGHDNLVAQRVYERVGFVRRADFTVYRSANGVAEATHL
jgi:ribosomal protein S18 acetylase RimI-like enzyme